MRARALSDVFVGLAVVGGALGYPLNAKRAMVTEVVYVTEIVDTVVYIDDHGVPFSTTTSRRTVPMSTSGFQSSTQVPSAQAPTATAAVPAQDTSVASSGPIPVLPTAVTSANVQVPSSSSPQVTERPAEYTPAPPPPPAPSAPPTSPSPVAVLPVTTSSQPSSAPEPKPSAATNDRFPLGITYDTYKGGQGNIECKSGEEMAAEFEKMKNFGIVRIYGNDCGVISVAVEQAKKNGQKLMAGIYTPNQNVNDVVNALSDAVHRFNDGDWDIVSLVSVENERVNARVVTVGEVHDTFNEARDALAKVGYSGPIGPVETVPAIIDNPSLCEKSDLTLVNIHAFFDPHTKAEDAGKFVRSEVARVQKACPDKRVVVTESGWPHQGTSHDNAVVSKSAQTAAINSIKAAFDHDLFLFNAFDSPWKSDDEYTFNAERWWGIL